MTNREFYKAVIGANVSEELKEFAKSEIDKLDKKNEKRKNTQKGAALYRKIQASLASLTSIRANYRSADSLSAEADRRRHQSYGGQGRC